MNTWWWVLIGLVAWFAVSVAVGLFLGPVLRRSSQAREALDAQTGEAEAPHAQTEETPAGGEKPPQNGHGPRAA
jgi:hypothetical protein